MQPWNILYLDGVCSILFSLQEAYMLFCWAMHCCIIPNTYENCELSSTWFQQMSSGTGGTPADERERLGPPLAVCEP